MNKGDIVQGRDMTDWSADKNYNFREVMNDFFGVDLSPGRRFSAKT